ncbi:MAG: putative O-linked N-acetylglucosamine transferase, SPINDLY family [Satyrvirus sp.]|uniref:Putative O-linked N-acetylglucosamine transferase, SPINDLY family n=1 Tax=Satyrvirus sp. TaxID=2487771 RepID=A0A3G5AJ09_9VIRU|nr:MAG: putative O-linked N-acetylglucosamine transferase, SPINDLY family [Satyrvirus sp.]
MEEKIFFIGFGKCGSTSFHMLMRKNKIISVHGGDVMEGWFINENYKKIKSRAQSYVYCDVMSPLNIDFVISKFPESFYILPSRNLIKWLISVINHFNNCYNNYFKNVNYHNSYLKNVTGLDIYNILKIRNEYYKKIQQLTDDNKIKNFLFIDIEKDNIIEKLKNFLPKSFLKYYRKYPRANKTCEDLVNNKIINNIIIRTFVYLEISEKDYESNWIIEILNNNINHSELMKILPLENP